MPRSRRERLLFRFLFRLARLFDLVGRALFYFAAGTLRRADLNCMSSAAWEDFGADAEVASAGLTTWERAVFAEFLKPTDRILLVGSGSGRDLLALRKAGHETVGVEPSRVQVERAKRLLRANGYSVDILESRLEHADLPGTFDVIVFSWFCYCYIIGCAERTAALTKVRLHLNPDGRILISYPDVDATLSTRATAIARLASRLTGSDWLAEANDYFYPTASPTPLYTFQHSFRSGELQAEARAAGLSVLAERRFPEAFVTILTA